MGDTGEDQVDTVPVWGSERFQCKRENVIKQIFRLRFGFGGWHFTKNRRNPEGFLLFFVYRSSQFESEDSGRREDLQRNIFCPDRQTRMKVFSIHAAFILQMNWYFFPFVFDYRRLFQV